MRIFPSQKIELNHQILTFPSTKIDISITKLHWTNKSSLKPIAQPNQMQIQILKNQNTTIFWILGSPTHFGPNSTGKGITACNTGGGSTQSNTNSNKYKYKLIILGSPTHFVDAKVVHWKGDYRRWLNLIKVCTLLWKVGHSIVCPYHYYYYFEVMKVDPHLSLKSVLIWWKLTHMCV